ncbi:MAG TPA: zinc-ribbon domain-containing protein [Candidatus Sulfotelmatobacter sp.]
MAREVKQSEESSALPTPELNPLLNPVLGQNMGRWAEVYFTAPPEKREEAVLELLRELQGKSDVTVGQPSVAAAQNEASRPAEFDVRRMSSTTAAESRATKIEEASPATLRCPSCGRENPANHKFCGRCGKPIEAVSVADLYIADMQVAESESAEGHFDHSYFERPVVEDVAQREAGPRAAQANKSRFVTYGDRVHETQPSNDDEEPPYRGSDAGNDFEMFRYLPASSSPHPYLRVALTVVAVAIAYLAWHNRQALRSAYVKLEAPPAVATPPTAPEPATSSSKQGWSETDIPKAPAPDQPQVNQPPANQQPSPQPVDNGLRANRQSESASVDIHRRKTFRPGAAEVATSTKNLPADIALGNGNEELITAQRYLNGTDGQTLNRTEAAKWLWKAVGKHNPDATLLLADLYLKGQGVGKNCDQARVLLDAAARQGIKGAGDQLRHLPAFGCQ